VINAWARSGSSSAAEKAEALFRRVQELDESEWPDVKPNTIMYTSVIKAWANAGDPDRAELLLKQMYEDYMLHGNSEVKPNKFSFNSVLSAWSKSSSPNAVDSAEALLRKMTELKKHGVLDSSPDVVSYNCILHTLAKRRSYPQAVAKAESLMEEMIEIATETGDKSVVPNLITYTALFRILAAASALPDTAERAKKWLDRAKEHGISDDRFLLDQFQTIARKAEGIHGPDQ
jgi:pentatricopeptide repeat protein